MPFRDETDKDDPSDNIKVEIARYFKVSLDFLLGVINEPVPYYNPDLFVLLPTDFTQKERAMLKDYLDYLGYRSGK